LYKGRAPEPRVFEKGALELRVVQKGAPKLRPVELGALELRAEEPGALELRVVERGALELGAVEEGALELRGVEVRLRRPCCAEVGTIEDRIRKINMTNIGQYQVRGRPIAARKGKVATHLSRPVVLSVISSFFSMMCPSFASSIKSSPRRAKVLTGAIKAYQFGVSGDGTLS
jgi:hypothetical protein